jgi:hypothetical protein
LRPKPGGTSDILLVFRQEEGESPYLTNRLLHGPAVDQILADEQLFDPEIYPPTTFAGLNLWPLADNLGTIRDIVYFDGQQSYLVNHLTYGAFGQMIAEYDTAIEHLFGYTGRERDEESDLQYNRARLGAPRYCGVLRRAVRAGIILGIGKALSPPADPAPSSGD